MGSDGVPHYETFAELFEEISYAHESKYPPHIEKDYVSFYKLGLTRDGQGSYKTSNFTFEPHLWPKVVALAKMLQPDPVEEVLYGKE